MCLRARNDRYVLIFNRVLQKYLIYAVLWSFSGDSRLKMRAELGEYIRRITTVSLPSAPNVPIIDYEVRTDGVSA